MSHGEAATKTSIAQPTPTSCISALKLLREDDVVTGSIVRACGAAPDTFASPVLQRRFPLARTAAARRQARPAAARAMAHRRRRTTPARWSLALRSRAHARLSADTPRTCSTKYQRTESRAGATSRSAYTHRRVRG